ncbi:MAG: HAMP domain-containing protein [Bdellovibrionales bacterium]|nr:HAMP domain-containing protein [Bdellovibrionales bacterium]
MTFILILATVFMVVKQSTDQFAEITTDRESSANINQAVARATEVDEFFQTYKEKIKIVASILKNEVFQKKKRSFINICGTEEVDDLHANKEGSQSVVQKDDLDSLALSFCDDKSLISVEIRSINDKNSIPARVVKGSYLAGYKDLSGQDLTPHFIDTLRRYQESYNRFDFSAVFAGQVEIRNSAFKGGAPLISMGIPLVRDELGNFTDIAVAEIGLDRLQKVFSKSSDRMTYLIDKEGNLLAHPNEKLVYSATPMNSSAIVDHALHKVNQNYQSTEPFVDPFTEKSSIGAYAKTRYGVTVIAQTSEEFIKDAATSVRRQSIYTTGKILSLSLLIIFLLSFSLTVPIENLVRMATEIAKGNFHVKSNVTSKDEVGALAAAFDDMVVGLEERDKVKNVLNKFHGSAIMDDLLSGNLELGGQNKEVTVFFSDIRDFTKFSEGHTPEEVVHMLNEYFQVMVGIINRNHGVVDKFIGDAIMAVWGAPNKSDDDTYNAIKACLEMRIALEELNKKRAGRGEVPIKIGIGIHTGRAISGNIGSDERMEYTVIGDAVNTAARIEASTKAFGTDLLISGEAAKIVINRFMVEEAGAVEVKGKEEPLRLNKVRGFIDENGHPVEVRTEFSDYEVGSDAKVKLVG